MLDLETLGTSPGSLILAIGAVKFSQGEITDTFYQRVDPQSCISVGLKMNVSTVMWWLTQGDEARLEITKPGQLLGEVLQDFSDWLNDPAAAIWGNGAAFDNVLLSVAYEKTGIPRPWKYSGDRCYRTIKSLHPEVLIQPMGTLHNALDDAKAQAVHLMQILNWMQP